MSASAGPPFTISGPAFLRSLGGDDGSERFCVGHAPGIAPGDNQRPGGPGKR